MKMTDEQRDEVARAMVESVRADVRAERVPVTEERICFVARLRGIEEVDLYDIAAVQDRIDALMDKVYPESSPENSQWRESGQVRRSTRDTSLPSHSGKDIL